MTTTDAQVEAALIAWRSSLAPDEAPFSEFDHAAMRVALEAAAQAAPAPPIISSNDEEICWEWPQAVIVSADSDGVHVALWRDGQWKAAP